MAARTRRKKKVKPAKKKVIKKRPAKKVVKKKLLKKKKSAKKSSKPKVIAVVTHFYDRINVAILKLKSPLQVGDFVCFRRNGQEFVQAVSSLQIEHAPVRKAGKGALVGVKVIHPIKEGAVVVPA